MISETTTNWISTNMYYVFTLYTNDVKIHHDKISVLTYVIIGLLIANIFFYIWKRKL